MTKIAALIVAAGRGHRFGGELPKQYCELGGEPILRRTLRPFIENSKIDRVLTVIAAEDQELYKLATKDFKLLFPVFGGLDRQASVLNGLEALKDYGPDIVLIHDAARPFVKSNMVSEVIEGLQKNTGVVPGLKVSDTIKSVRNGLIAATVDRTDLWHVQTPQGFHFSAILEAHRQSVGMDFTDDAAVGEWMGLDIAMIEGHKENIKITDPDDMRMNDNYQIPEIEYRTGQGFDVHRFEAGFYVNLCGVVIDHDHGLAGHSDADVALHALTDALLGAVGAGDIGEHFPPSDMRWSGADSSIFVSHALDLIKKKNGQIINVDITLICEAPKIKPHKEAMLRALGEMLSLKIDRINVKATTTETLGFTGRKEGIAAHAVATICLPLE